MDQNSFWTVLFSALFWLPADNVVLAIQAYFKLKAEQWWNYRMSPYESKVIIFVLPS